MRTVDQFTTLIKVGGSITERGSRSQIKELGQIITEQYEKWGNFIIIPGGGIFAEVIRDIQKQYSITDEVAHWMAILAIDQHGLLLSNYIPKSEIIDLNKLRMLDKNSRQMKVPILEVYEFAKDYSKLEHSWNTTSDALACEIALFLGVKKIIFVKDIDGLILNKKHISTVTT
ncbi:MAG: amino acid kinase family protein, partial [Candidatus Heimdallarchaeota archaeon]